MTQAALAMTTALRSSMEFSAPPAPDRAPAPPAKPSAPTGNHRRFPVWVLGIAAGLGLAAGAIYIPQGFVETTDDAYVQADTVSVVPKVSGYVTALHVTDNSRFKANDLLVEIDPRDFAVAVQSAEADLQSAQASKVNVTEQLAEQAHVIAAAQATVDSDRAQLQFAQQQLARYASLAKDGTGTQERWQQAVSDIGQRKAGLDHDQATLAAAQGQAGVLQSQSRQADAAIVRQQAALAQARLNLSYTKIYAPMDGTVANRTVQTGNFVQPGQTLFSAVPTDIYVLANFKETQLALMRAGQKVLVRIDAFPDRRIDGHIDSFQRGTGSNFALLPPENATGNFVKVVQRVPVKIVLDDPTSALRGVAPGMSVEPTVTIAQPPRWVRPLLALIGDPAV
jgi:membrane fusion protein (multidrug efflux system)